MTGLEGRTFLVTGASSGLGLAIARSAWSRGARLALCGRSDSKLKAAHPHLAATGSGMVINILTSCCLFANEGLGAYTASKTALEGLTKVYRKEARLAGIRVCAVYPGGIDTPFRPQARPEYLKPDEVAEAVLALASSPVGLCPDELVLRPSAEKNYS